MEENNPYKPPVAQTMEPLGSLAQAARGKEINQAQRILIWVGGMTMVLNGFFLFNLQNDIQQAIQQNQIAPADVEQFRQTAMISGYVIYGLPTLLGVLFVVFGLVVKQYPVSITITSLVLYILATAAFGLLNPATLVQGLIIKTIIIFALIRAIKAARAYHDPAQEVELAGGLSG